MNSSYKKNGAGNGTWTRDPQLGKLMLYHLSYARFFIELKNLDGVYAVKEKNNEMANFVLPQRMQSFILNNAA